MSAPQRQRFMLSLAGEDSSRPLVERPEPGKAPTAFRIWAHGRNEADGDVCVFSERSAKMLLDEQAARGRLYCFDYDHRSVMPDVSPEAGKAAGWHVLDVRPDENGKPELWASACDWTPAARAGLEVAPPEWRYFSPCFFAEKESREVVSYVNMALTNNPLTHQLPALASAIERPAKWSGRLTVARLRVKELAVRTNRR